MTITSSPKLKELARFPNQGRKSKHATIKIEQRKKIVACNSNYGFESINDMSSSIDALCVTTEDPLIDDSESDGFDTESSASCWSAGCRSESSFSDTSDEEDGENDDLP